MTRPRMVVIPPDDDPGGSTPFERFDKIMRRLLSVSKEEMDRRIDSDERKGKPTGRKRRKRTAKKR